MSAPRAALRIIRADRWLSINFGSRDVGSHFEIIGNNIFRTGLFKVRWTMGRYGQSNGFFIAVYSGHM